MKTVWILFYVLWPGSNASVSFTVQNIATEQECHRIASELADWSTRFALSPRHKCIQGQVK